MEHVGRPGLDTEALDAFEGEHEPDPLAGLDGVEVRRNRDLRQALGALAKGAVERGHHRERLSQRPLGLDGDVDVDRAHLECDAALLEKRKPRRGEHVALAEAALAVGELHEQVDVGVGDHARGR